MLALRVMKFLQDAQPGDKLALSTDACCEIPQGIWLAAERLTQRRSFWVCCSDRPTVMLSHGGTAEVLLVAGEIARETGRDLEE